MKTILLLVLVFLAFTLPASAEFVTGSDNITIFSLPVSGGVQTIGGQNVITLQEPLSGRQGNITLTMLNSKDRLLTGPQVVTSTPSGGQGGIHGIPFEFIILNRYGSSYIHPSNFFPELGETVSVNVTLTSAVGVGEVRLHYQVNNASWENKSMLQKDASATYGTTLPTPESGSVKYYVTASKDGFTLQTPPIYDQLFWGERPNSFLLWLSKLWDSIFQPRPLAVEQTHRQPFTPPDFNPTPLYVLGGIGALVAGLALPFTRGLLIGGIIKSVALLASVLMGLLSFVASFGLSQAFRSRQTFTVFMLFLAAVGGAVWWVWFR